MKALIARLAGAAIGASLIAAPAMAEDASSPDVRCLTIAALMVGNGGQAQQAGFVSALYYIGRLDGRSPGLDLKARILEEAQALTPDKIEAERLRCSRQLQERGAALQTVGEALKQMGQSGK